MFKKRKEAGNYVNQKFKEMILINPLARRIFQNSAILVLILSGVKNLYEALPIRFIESFDKDHGITVTSSYFSTHHTLSFLLGLLALLLSWRVYKRVRVAWGIELLTLSGTIAVQIVLLHSPNISLLILEVYSMLILSLSYKDFSRKADIITIKKALGYIGVSILLVLSNATIGILVMRLHFANIHNIYDALLKSIKLLFLMDISMLEISGKIGRAYADSLIIINWSLILLSTFLILKPLIFSPIQNSRARDMVQELVNKYGQNPVAYLSLGNDKKYFFGNNVEGVCSYSIVSKVFVVCGDMICAEKDGFEFLNEIIAFCKQNGYEILFVNITNVFMDLYKMAGFGILKCGEDACFKISDYKLEGGKVAKVRAAINHANKAGISVLEYKPLEVRNNSVEKQIAEITKEWLIVKGGEELGFMLGGTELDNPLDRRYFYAIDEAGTILGYVVFLPYLSGKAYLADVTRRRNNAPQGVIEKIIYTAFMKMKEEGVIWGNMGLSPLYNIAENEKTTFTEKLFSYIYENLNSSYNFKALHHSKEKFSPTDWMPRYLAYSPRPFSPKHAYSLVKVQTGSAFTHMVIEEIRRKNV